MRNILKKLEQKQDLTTIEAEQSMNLIMSGQATSEQMSSFLSLLATKGETVEEITGLAKIMREFSQKVESHEPLLDNCGTGGSGLSRLNVSTASAFVLAAQGVKVAKHGNRAAGGRSGSFDVLEALGAKIELLPKQVEKTIKQLGLGFMFAPLYHPAMKYVAPVRKALGIRTVFNILGPLTNPANTEYQVLGVSNKELAPKMIAALKNLGSKKVLLVHGADGLDEVTNTDQTYIWELDHDQIKHYTITPEEFGLQRATWEAVAGGNAQENAQAIKDIFSGKISDARLELILLNVAAGLLAYEKINDWSAGIQLARETIQSGQAEQKLIDYVALSQQL